MNEPDLRIECLRLAVTYSGAALLGDEITPAVDLAQKFYDFVRGNISPPPQTLKNAA